MTMQSQTWCGFSLCLLTMLGVLAGGWQPAAAEPAQKSLAGRRPNIVLVMTDDQGKGELSCLGNEVLKTPHLDELYSQSTRFTDFHVSPTCAPTRSALLTGRHEFRNGITHTILERERLTLNTQTLPQVLAEAGYGTGIFGKWHLGDEDEYQPGQRGFGEVFIHGAGGIGQAYDSSCADAPPNKQNTYFDCVFRHNGQFVQTAGFCTDVIFDAALSWMQTRAQQPEPFFCYLVTNAPHAPMIAPASYKQPFLDLGFDEPTAARYGMIANIDDNIGRLMGKMTEWGLDDNTLFIFMTDNGQSTLKGKQHGKPVALFSGGMRDGKGSPYEGGTRVPAFWRWPGVLRPGQDVDQLVAHMDVFDTLTALAGGQPAVGGIPRDGRTLLPLLEAARVGATPEALSQVAWPDRYLFTHVGRWEKNADPNTGKFTKCAVRSERFRFVNNRELYDIEADPAETTNVIDQHPEVVAEMRKAYEAWWATSVPLMVNENVPNAPERPYWVAFERQQASGGIPAWSSSVPR